MAYELATAKTMLNIPPADTTRDAVITMALNAALALVERYCDRKFFLATEGAELLRVRGDRAQVHRYPIVQVLGMSYNGDYDVANDAGIIVFRRLVQEDRITIDYVGGYAVLPADLEAALWALFNVYWGEIGGGTGGATGLAAGSVESVTLQGVGTVRFATGGQAQADASTGTGLEGILGPLHAATLRLFRRLDS